MVDYGQLFGRGISFPPRVGPDGRVTWSEGEQNVRESIRVILMTEPGERIMLPQFGGGLGRYLFEPNTVATRHQIQQQIERVLRRWEPRISVEEVTVEADPADPQAALVTIHYRLVATQAREQTSFSLALTGT